MLKETVKQAENRNDVFKTFEPEETRRMLDRNNSSGARRFVVTTKLIDQCRSVNLSREQ